MKTNTDKTQITRIATSAPARFIHETGMDKCEYLLHFGEGKAFFDTNLFKLHADFVDAYDPYSPDASRRVFPKDEYFERVVAIYVFNTLAPLDRDAAINDAMSLVDTDGELIVAVRADKIVGAAYWDGVVTKRGTFQKSYTMAEVKKEFGKYGRVRIEAANAGFILFTLTKEDQWQ